MKYDKLIGTGDAPDKGWMLVYFRDEVLFKRYSSKEYVKNALGDRDILEIHLFDDETEYRAISSESSRFKRGVIEHVARFKNDADVYAAKSLPVADTDGVNSITVLNHLDYNEWGMSFVDDYRLTVNVEEVK